MKKVFIFEDNQTIMDMYKTAFEARDYTVFTSSSGENSVEKIIKTSPDIILLDIMMPDANGLEVLKLLKENPETKSIPVFMNSNLQGEGILQEGMSLGASKYFIKTETDPDTVINMANDLLTGKSA